MLTMVCGGAGGGGNVLWLAVLPNYPFFFLQRCFQTTNGYISDSRACASNYSVAALATSSLVGRSPQPSSSP